MQDKMADRRDAPRYPLVFIAEVTDVNSGIRISARTSDLSRTGCYIDTLKPFPSGSMLRVKLSHEGEGFEVHGTVRYVSPGMGMGIQFEAQLPVKQLATLDCWLTAAAKQPV